MLSINIIIDRNSKKSKVIYTYWSNSQSKMAVKLLSSG